MAEAGVPTAASGFHGRGGAEAYARGAGRIVVKADGLAAGKGVIVAPARRRLAGRCARWGAMGAPGQRMVLEELLEGEEVSVIALCDGERYVLLPPAQDHKRVGEGDPGPTLAAWARTARCRSSRRGSWRRWASASSRRCWR